MEFKKPNSAAVSNGAALIGGSIAGAMLSRGVIGAVHTPVVSTDAAVLAKDANKLLMYRGALVLLAGYGAIAISGNDMGTTLAKGALSGMAVMQTVEIVKEYAAKSASLNDTSTGTKKFIAKTLGLGCGCADAPVYQTALNGVAKRRYLRGLDMEQATFQPNALDQAVQSGRINI